MEPYAGVDYNLTLCPLQNRLQHIYHGHWATLCQNRPEPYARVDFIPQSGTLDLGSVQYIYISRHVCCTSLNNCM
jgi:hypothetical protein